MTGTTDFSYDYQNIVRDLEAELLIVNQQMPNLLSLFGVSPTPCFQNKHEWQNLVLKPERDAVNGAVLIGATTITVDTGSSFVKDMQIAFEGTDEIAYVTDISGNNLTVVRGYGGSTASALADNTVIIIVSRPRQENSLADPKASGKPDTNYNYTEIFDETVSVSGSAQYTRIYGIPNPLDNAIMQAINKIQRRMNMAAIHGRRVARTASVISTMGGLLNLITLRSNAAGGALSTTIINDAIESAFLAGGKPDTIVVNTNQARRISELYRSQLLVPLSVDTAGTQISRFQSDLPIGVIQNVVVEPNWPKTKLGLLTSNLIQLDPFQGRSLHDVDATIPGQDGFSRRVIGEYTLEVLNAGQAHAIVDNLTL